MSSADPKMHEPTMDDILASIRRIIADDHPREARAAEPDVQTTEQAAGDAFEDELEPSADDPAPAKIDAAPALEMWNEPPADVEAAAIEGSPSSPFPAHIAPAAAPPVPPMLRRAPSPMIEDPASAGHDPATHLAASAGLAGLATARVAGPVSAATPAPDTLISSTASTSVGDSFHALSHTILTSNNARTLEDIVKDMLRPMLQVWLDDNLPPLVERLVRAEIERVARGRS